MREILLLLVVALVAAAIVFGVAVLVTGGDRGMSAADPDDRYGRLPGNRPLDEEDTGQVRFDVTFRGYRMAQVDQVLSRVGYDLGYKQELISALEAEVDALRDGRKDDADLLRERRLAATAPSPTRMTTTPTAATELTDAEPADVDSVDVDSVDVDSVDIDSDTESSDVESSDTEPASTTAASTQPSATKSASTESA